MKYLQFQFNKALPQNGVVMIPIVANYYFNQKPTENIENIETEDKKPLLYSAQPRVNPTFYKTEDQKPIEYSAASMDDLKILQ